MCSTGRNIILWTVAFVSTVHHSDCSFNFRRPSNHQRSERGDQDWASSPNRQQPNAFVVFHSSHAADSLLHHRAERGETGREGGEEPSQGEERKRFVLEQLVTAPSSLRAAEAAAVSDPRREGGAKIVPKLGGGAEEKAVSEAKLERRASSRTNPNQDTTGVGARGGKKGRLRRRREQTGNERRKGRRRKPKHLVLKFSDLEPWSRQSGRRYAAKVSAAKTVPPPLAAWATNFGSLPYPDSNGLTQRDRDYFRMVRTENGFSDLVVVAKEGKEKEKEEEKGGGGGERGVQLEQVQINQRSAGEATPPPPTPQRNEGTRIQVMATAAANESHSQLAEGAAVAAARTRSSGTAAEDERSATGGDAAAKDGVGQEAAAEEEKETYHHRDPHHFQSYRPRFIYRRVTASSSKAGEVAAAKSSPRAMAAVSLAGIGSRTV